ncbi:long-chain fatty acid--CoA ligase, partial [Nonomuraea sp. KC401]|uniref:AMP-binding protein n=1 Tax=Nonomuraea sp. KC401 TaxID=1848324 RepID=UPI0010FDF8C6
MTATYTKMIAATTEWLARHSIDALRISVGLVFLGFGFLKFFPGVSPAEELAVGTLEQLTFGVVSGGVALAVVAVTECFIGLTLVTGKFLKSGLLVMAGALVGFMSPLVETFFAAGLLGAVFVPLNTRLATPELRYILEDADAKLLVLG